MKVVLKPGREKPTKGGHPWVFSGAVASVSKNAVPGDEVEVFSAGGEKLGIGAYSSASQIQVRMIGRAGFAPVGRERFFAGLENTNAFRLIHAEGDGVPGVVADWYDGWISVQLSSVWAERRKSEIAGALMAIPGAKCVYNRSDVASRMREGLPVEGDGVEGLLAGDEPPEKVEIFEGPMRLLVDIRRGHKTGYYLDQRDARREVAKYCAGKRVLNCFSYTGGFGVAAALAGASGVLNIDASADALELAAQNAALNGVSMECRAGDVFKELRRMRDSRETFDVIVLDPPKFAEKKSQLERAMRGYKDINLLAMKLLAPGGILATFSCSGAVTPDIFNTILREAAQDSKRCVRVLERLRQGADHPVPVTFPEGEYLKGAILQVLP